MDAMILSAGLGTRMRPLTESIPKPLLRVGKHRLIEYHLHNLKLAGISNIVINTSYLADMFLDVIGDGSAYGVDILYSHEREPPLNTGGGVRRALPLLQSDPFLIVNADIWTDFPFSQLHVPGFADGCLILVDNPAHNSDGDFILTNGKLNIPDAEIASQTLTYSGISILRKSLFSNTKEVNFPLYSLFSNSIERGKLSGRYYKGIWHDVGSPGRLEQVTTMLDSEKLKSASE